MADHGHELRFHLKRFAGAVPFEAQFIKLIEAAPIEPQEDHRTFQHEKQYEDDGEKLQPQEALQRRVHGQNVGHRDVEKDRRVHGQPHIQDLRYLVIVVCGKEAGCKKEEQRHEMR